ncbi:MAG: DUF2190 family protein [Candidatus Omnitrophica bacterium]|nr:DUF2190 family protein [Candidatus Omnitrophota bacterium]MDD5592654.1 DUF2190 family protein [Candidatus Omnitrophota bacterium]
MYTDNGVKTFTAGEALARARRVKLSSGYGTQVEYADAADDYIGVTLEAAASGEPVAVKLKRNSEGTVEVEASGIITAGATIYGAADGKVSTSSTGTDKFGKALEAASGDGAVIEGLMDD